VRADGLWGWGQFAGVMAGLAGGEIRLFAGVSGFTCLEGLT